MPNSHGSMPGGGGLLPPLNSKSSDKDRKSQMALSDGVAGVVDSQKGSGKTTPAGNIKKGLALYDAGKASAVQKHVQNLINVWNETEDRGNGNDLSSSESVLHGKKPVRPADRLAKGDGRNKQEKVRLIRDANGGQVNPRVPARVEFQGDSMQSSTNDDHRDHQEKGSVHQGQGFAAGIATASREMHFQKGKGVHENEGMADGMIVEEFSDSD
jgi:hypothetical protein